MGDVKLDNNSAYKVLARKYSPATFADLIGQNIMVKIFKNSFLSERISHAFMLTGVRGVGKTTTARIVAKGLNCTGLDGSGGPTVAPCGQCETCGAISSGNHVDVLEIDAASRTGVADMREIIDSVRYRAASARFKIYIIDEVHMLSISAFNALLKTLEEPPEHVKFIFATTEIKKVPMTILSRCQRFDLRRIEPEEMVKYLQKVSVEEGFSIGEDCLGQVAKASEGSMRDALSLLEQILVDSDGKTDLQRVRLILGLSDRGRIIGLFEALVEGNIAGALEQFNAMHNEGADPLALVKELCEITHWITLIKVSPDLVRDVTISPDERSRGSILSERLSIPFLTRLWQLLLKVLDETAIAVDPKIAAEMGLIRIAYASDLPTPGELIKHIKVRPEEQRKSTEKILSKTTTGNLDAPSTNNLPDSEINQGDQLESTVNLINTVQKSESDGSVFHIPKNFMELVDLIRTKREIDLLIEVEDNLRLVNYQIGRIEFEPTETASKELASRLGAFLKKQTGDRWVISVVSNGGGTTLKEKKLKKEIDQEAELIKHPVVAAVFDFFPNARIEKVHDITENNTSSNNSTVSTGYLRQPVEKE